MHKTRRHGYARVSSEQRRRREYQLYILHIALIVCGTIGMLAMGIVLADRLGWLAALWG